MNDKPIYIAFASKKLEKDFEKLKQGKFEDKQLCEFIERESSSLNSITETTSPNEDLFCNNTYLLSMFMIK